MEKVEFAQWARGGFSSLFGSSGRSFCTANQENLQPEKERAQWAYSRSALSFLCSTALSMS